MADGRWEKDESLKERLKISIWKKRSGKKKLIILIEVIELDKDLAIECAAF
jgi:hypothetical protein